MVRIPPILQLNAYQISYRNSLNIVLAQEMIFASKFEWTVAAVFWSFSTAFSNSFLLLFISISYRDSLFIDGQLFNVFQLNRLVSVWHWRLFYLTPSRSTPNYWHRIVSMWLVSVWCKIYHCKQYEWKNIELPSVEISKNKLKHRMRDHQFLSTGIMDG